MVSPFSPGTEGAALRRDFLLVLLVTVVFALLRAPTLALPPLGFDSWRETDVLMVGRNFCREQAPLWEPRIDARGETPGITGMEFPLLNWVQGQAACAGIDQVLAGRLVSLLFALLAILCVGHLGARLALPGGGALAAALFASSPLVWYYGRGLQPDVPSLALALNALVLLELAVSSSGVRAPLALASAASFALGVLVKLPVIVFALPALVLVVSRLGLARTLRAWVTWVYGLIVVLPALAWYAHARALQERYGLYHFFLGKPLRELASDWLRPSFYQSIFLKKLFDAYAFPLVSAVAVLTLALAWKRLPAWLRALAIATLAYFFLAGHHAEHHFYYGIPATPLLALAAAAGFGLLLQKWPRAMPLVIAVCVVSMGYAFVRTRSMHAAPEAPQPLVEARERLLGLVGPEAKVVLFSKGDPTLLWFIDRRGWIAPPEDAEGWFARGSVRPPALIIDRRRYPPDAHAPLAEVLTESGYRPVSDGRAELWVHLPTGHGG